MPVLALLFRCVDSRASSVIATPLSMLCFWCCCQRVSPPPPSLRPLPPAHTPPPATPSNPSPWPLPQASCSRDTTATSYTRYDVDTQYSDGMNWGPRNEWVVAATRSDGTHRANFKRRGLATVADTHMGPVWLAMNAPVEEYSSAGGRLDWSKVPRTAFELAQLTAFAGLTDDELETQEAYHFVSSIGLFVRGHYLPEQFKAAEARKRRQSCHFALLPHASYLAAQTRNSHAVSLRHCSGHPAKAQLDPPHSFKLLDTTPSAPSRPSATGRMAAVMSATPPTRGRPLWRSRCMASTSSSGAWRAVTQSASPPSFSQVRARLLSHSPAPAPLSVISAFRIPRDHLSSQ